MPASIVARQTRQTTQLTKCSFLPCQTDAVIETGASLCLCHAHYEALLFIRWSLDLGLLSEEVAMALAQAKDP